MNETILARVEGDLNIAAHIGAALGGPVGVIADAGLQAGEAVVNSVVASEAAHATALQAATAAAASLATAAAPVVAALPAADAAKAQAGLSLLQTVLADLKSIFSL